LNQPKARQRANKTFPVQDIPPISPKGVTPAKSGNCSPWNQTGERAFVRFPRLPQLKWKAAQDDLDPDPPQLSQEKLTLKQ